MIEGSLNGKLCQICNKNKIEVYQLEFEHALSAG
jgi:hypothetical protein